MTELNYLSFREMLDSYVEEAKNARKNKANPIVINRFPLHISGEPAGEEIYIVMTTREVCDAIENAFEPEE